LKTIAFAAGSSSRSPIGVVEVLYRLAVAEDEPKAW
jgi:hypothetical protein